MVWSFSSPGCRRPFRCHLPAATNPAAGSARAAPTWPLAALALVAGCAPANHCKKDGQPRKGDSIDIPPVQLRLRSCSYAPDSQWWQAQRQQKTSQSAARIWGSKTETATMGYMGCLMVPQKRESRWMVSPLITAAHKISRQTWSYAKPFQPGRFNSLPPFASLAILSQSICSVKWLKIQETVLMWQTQ